MSTSDELPLTDQELQSLRNFGNEAEAAADEIAQLRTDLEASRLECERLRVDAERYRWLRSSEDESVIDSIYPFSLWENSHWMKRYERLDIAIDSAMKKERT